MKNKRAQEEIIGFVLVILVVAIIFLVAFSIFIRQRGKVERDQSAEISQFLDAFVEITTNCSIPPSGYAKLKISEAIVECAENSVTECYPGKTICAEVKEKMGEIVRSAWNIHPASPYIGYHFTVENASRYIINNMTSTSGAGEAYFIEAERLLPTRTTEVLRLKLKIYLSKKE